MLPRRIGFFNAIRAFWLGRMFNGARLHPICSASAAIVALRRSARQPADLNEHLDVALCKPALGALKAIRG